MYKFPMITCQKKLKEKKKQGIRKIIEKFCGLSSPFRVIQVSTVLFIVCHY